jgi:ferritin-like metal-binding protein YciE
VWKLIAPSATQAYQSVLARDASESRLVIERYLEDAEAAERNFEDALASFSKTGDQPEVQSLLGTMSMKARTQHERLEMRLKSLGGSRSAAKSILAHFLGFSPVSAQLGHLPSEKNTQHLMITYSAAAPEMAMYEALAAVSAEAGDRETERLARELQSEEKEDHRLARGSYCLVAPALRPRRSNGPRVRRVSGPSGRAPGFGVRSQPTGCRLL